MPAPSSKSSISPVDLPRESEDSAFVESRGSTAGWNAFAEFGDGLEGLIHVSQLSVEEVTHPEKVVEVGQKVKAKIIKVDLATKKIGLSVKAFEENLDSSAIEEEQAQLEDNKPDAEGESG